MNTQVRKTQDRNQARDSGGGPGTWPRCVALLFLCVTLAAVTQCAAFNRKNTPLVAAIETHLVPDSTPAKVAVFPLILPLGIVAGLIDVFIIHPISVIPDATRDVRRWIWRPQSKSGYVTIIGSIPFKLLATPPVFLIDWLGRSAFDLSRSSRTRRPEPGVKGPAIVDLIAEGREDEAAGAIYNVMGDTARNESEALRAVFPRTKTGHLRSAIVSYLGHPPRFAENEVFLVGALGGALGDRRERPETDMLIHILADRKSARASRLLLDAIRAGNLSDERTVLAIQAVFRIGVAEDIRRLRTVLRTLPE